MDTLSASGRFEIDLTPGDALIPACGRFDFTKTWTGEVEGSSVGLMMSAGDPASGNAGYVALETFHGSVGDRRGTFVFQQFGTMQSGEADLSYVIAPGSGTGDFEGWGGELALDVVEGVHQVTLTLRNA